MDRIKLQLLTKEDITDEFVSWHTEEHTTFFSSSKRTFKRETLLAELEDGLAAGNLFQYGIYHIEDQKLIGTVKLGPINKIHMTSDLVTLVGDKNYLRMGLASEAIKLVNAVAFGEHKLRKLFSGMYRGNVGSVKAYLNGDWVIEGILRNQYLDGTDEHDRILVACFNPAMYTDPYYSKGLYSFEEVYGS